MNIRNVVGWIIYNEREKSRKVKVVLGGDESNRTPITTHRRTRCSIVFDGTHMAATAEIQARIIASISRPIVEDRETH